MDTAAAAAATAAVAARGEISLTLEGVEYVLRPTFEAIGQIETALGKNLFSLAQAAEQQQLTLAEVGTIAAMCIRAQAQATSNDLHANIRPERIAMMIFAEPGGALVAVRAAIHPLLIGALTGGYTALGEPRPKVTTS
jgi:hypothetical protein